MSIVLYMVLGLLAGALAGLLGIGGGTIIVPGLSVIYHYDHFPDTAIMHMAVGTSLATMILTSPMALLSHLRHTKVEWPIFKLLLPGLIIGGVSGVFIADYLPTAFLRLLFGCFMLLLSINVFFNKRSANTDDMNLPGPMSIRTAGLIIGFTSGLLGVGGGSLTIPYLISYQVPMAITVTLATSVTLVVALMGTITAIITGFNEAGLPPHTLGYVYWPAMFAVGVFSMVAAYTTAPFAHKLPESWLRRLFAIFIMIVALHMLSVVKL